MAGRAALTRLSLIRFRSWRSASVELDGRPVVIHGPNGAGKTNLVEAVSVLSPGRGLRRAATGDMARAGGDAGWKVSARLISDDGPRDLATWSDGRSRLVSIDEKPAPHSALSSVLRVLWMTPAMDRLWSEGAAERRRFLDRIAFSLVPDHAAAVLAYDRAMRERNRLLKEQSRDDGWYEALEAQMAAHGTAISASRLEALDLLGQAQGSAETAFPRAGLRLEASVPGGEQDLAAALRAGRPRDLAAARSLAGPHRDDLAAVYAAKGVEARLCSTGEQKALLISLILANARAVVRKFGAAPVLILDEVAAHLDADRRAALYDEICAIDAQAWMTGTGPELFSCMGDRAQRLAIREAGGASVIEAG